MRFSIEFSCQGSKFRAFSSLLLGAFLLLCDPLTAAGARIVYFDVSRHNETFNQDQTYPDRFYSKCMLTITNSSTNDQTYTVTFTGKAVVEVGAHDSSPSVLAEIDRFETTDLNGSISGPSLGPQTLSAGQRASWIWTFPPSPSLTIAKQDVRCFGSVSVDNADSTNPGFITANGVITSWLQNTALRSLDGTGDPLQASMIVTNTPFSVGDDRPF